MQLKPWIVGVNFGDGPTAQLYVNAIVAPTSELAVAHVVAMTLQQIKTDQPLTRIMWQEVEAEFLTAALSLMRGAAAGETVVSLRVVEEPKAEAPRPHDFPLPEQPLAERLQSAFEGSGPGQQRLWQPCSSCSMLNYCERDGTCHGNNPPAFAS